MNRNELISNANFQVSKRDKAQYEEKENINRIAFGLS